MLRRPGIYLILLLCLVWGRTSGRAEDSTIHWDTAQGLLTADIHQQPLFAVLEIMAKQSGWHIFVEPDAARTVDVKFADLPVNAALRKIVGDLNLSYIPKTNGLPELYIFRTTQSHATQAIGLAPAKTATNAAKYVKNELLVKLKPGADINAIAKSVGAKVVGSDDKLGIYRLQFENEADMQAALALLKSNNDVATVDYNYYFDPPPQPQQVTTPANSTQPKLTLDDTTASDPCHPTIAVIDTAIQSLGANLDQFVNKPITVVEDATTGNEGVTHGTAMINAILDAIAQAAGNNGGTAKTSIKIQPIVVYQSGEQTTTWNVALGVQAAVNSGATVLNMSLGSSTDSAILDDIIQKAQAKGVVIFAAAGNTPVTSPTYPAALTGVNAVTALSSPGQLASYANRGSFVSMALPGANVVTEGNLSYLVQGTSTATAYASGIAAATKGVNCAGWSQITGAMQQKFPVPQP
ncbi:MAG TPA: S8 family serine peptidase [Verrucomicrobiae bacterium]